MASIANRVRALVFLLAVSASLLSACSNATLKDGCSSNADCTAGYECNQGRCGCASNAVCAKGQFCNSAGSCQSLMGCQTTLDCPSGEYCNTTSGTCIDSANCTKDVQCNMGEICDTTTFVCESGCRDPGDCQWAQVCQCPSGALLGQSGLDGGLSDGGGESSDAGPPACALGVCVTGPCADNSYCQYGQTCVIDPTDSANNRCEFDTSGPFCAQCQIEPGNAYSYCPTSPGANNMSNFCLVDTTMESAQEFCGVDCSANANSCPWGFECDDVLVLTSSTCGNGFSGCPLEPGATCSNDTDCTMTGGGHCVIPSGSTTGTCLCATDVDCPAGTCDTASGKCQGQCIINEGSVQGFCTCIQDSECPTETCQSNGFCAITGKSCDPDVSNSCGPIFCKKTTDPLSGMVTGYCWIGENCAPENGVTCNQVGAN